MIFDAVSSHRALAPMHRTPHRPGMCRRRAAPNMICNAQQDPRFWKSASRSVHFECCAGIRNNADFCSDFGLSARRNIANYLR